MRLFGWPPLWRAASAAASTASQSTVASAVTASTNAPRHSLRSWLGAQSATWRPCGEGSPGPPAAIVASSHRHIVVKRTLRVSRRVRHSLETGYEGAREARSLDRSHILQRKSVGLRRHAAAARHTATVLGAISHKGQSVMLHPGPAQFDLIGHVMDRLRLESDRSHPVSARPSPRRPRAELL